MLDSESQKRSDERLKTLHHRKKKYERLHSSPIKQKESDQWYSIQQERYRTLIENVPCALYSAYPGKAGPTTFISNKWKDWTGYSPGELYQDPEAWTKCIHPDDREKAISAYYEACRDNVPYNLEYRIVHRQTEQVRYVSDQGLLSTDGKGDIVRVDGIITDISDRKRAENAVQESEKRFQAMFEKLPNVAVQGYGPDGTIHYWNKANESIYGYTAEEAIGKDLVELIIPPEMRDYVREAIARGVSTGEMPAAAELNLMRKDGSRVPVWSSHAVVRHAGKEPELFCIDVDLRELKHAEKELRESEERFKNIFNNALVGLYRTTPDGRILMANPALLRMLGYDCFEELARRNLEEVGFEPQYSRSEFKKRIETDGRVIGLEANWVRGDGTILSIRESAKAIRDEHEKTLYYEGTVEDITQRKCAEQELKRHRDHLEEIVAVRTHELEKNNQALQTEITERKQAEEALRESEERLKILFESAPDAIYLIDSEGRFVDFNRAALELVGYTREEVNRKSLMELGLLSPGQLSKAQTNLKKAVAGKLSGPNEYTLTRKDGSQVSVEVRTFPVKIEGKMQTLGIARDVTMHKQTEQELLEHQARLKSLASQLSLTEERERHRLATDLHDQISQSLVISKIKLDQLRKSSTSDEFNTSLKDICNCLGKIIDDTRALTFDLSYPILYELGFEAAVAEWLSDQIQEKHQIKTEFVDDGQQKPLDDDIRVLLFRNVRELLINVIKHAKASKLRVSIRRDNEYINVGVEDDGVGFDPVEVTSMAAKRAKFGLFSIRERLEQLGGMIEIDSEPGYGSRITMRAPLKYNSSTDRKSK